MIRKISTLIGFLLCESFLLSDTKHIYDGHLNVDRQETTEEVCQTTGCLKAAESIKANIDESVNPCDDFFEFACGNFVKTHELSEDRPKIDIFSILEDERNKKLKALMDKDLTDSDPSFVKLIKDFFISCTDTDSINSAGVEPLKRVLETLGGWPVVEGDKWNETSFDWIDTVLAMRRVGYDHGVLIDLEVGTDYRNNTEHIMKVDQPTLPLGRSSYFAGLKKNKTKLYFELMVNSANKLGADDAKSEDELMKVLEFETKLANISWSAGKRRNFTSMYNKYTVQKLQEEVPEINWLKFFNGLLNDSVTLEDSVIVKVPDFVKNFTILLKNTEKRVVANYLMWQVVYDSINRLSEEWRTLKRDFKTETEGTSEEPPRWEVCMNEVSNTLDVALSAYYVRNYFQESSKKAADEMVSYLRNEFLKLLESSDWMDPETKEKAKEKAKATRAFIGYMPELMDDAKIADYYKNLILSRDNYFENMLKLWKFFIDVQFSELRKPALQDDWKTYADAAMIDAYYHPVKNTMVFPAGFLQDALFNADRPNYMNFGSIGIVIGHEVTHGFDDMGRQFDKDGRNVNWWDDATDLLFKEKAQCFIDQYRNYSEYGVNLNGFNSQGENIADNGGTKEAYLAYHSWVKDHGPEPKLPGLNYNPSQLFWISVANVWCSKYTPEHMKQSIQSDFHSPPRYRVIGPLSNNIDFARDFNCPPGSPMNPEKKCKIW